MIRLERNDARMVRWIYNVMPEDRISVEKLWTRLKYDGVFIGSKTALAWSSGRDGRKCLASIESRQ